MSDRTLNIGRYHVRHDGAQWILTEDQVHSGRGKNPELAGTVIESPPSYYGRLESILVAILEREMGQAEAESAGQMLGAIHQAHDAILREVARLSPPPPVVLPAPEPIRSVPIVRRRQASAR